MNNNEIRETAIALQQEWGMQLPDNISEEEILRLLAERVVVLLQMGADNFYQLMYRLDISEKKLSAVLGAEDVPVKIARLIYDRQLQKIQSRKDNKQSGTWDEDPELRW